MSIKEFIFDIGLRKLFYKSKELEKKIKNNDPVLENIILGGRDYKKYFCYPGKCKIRIVISFIIMIYIAFFSSAAAVLPELLIQNPTNKISAIFFIVTLIIIGLTSLLQVGFISKGYYYGSVIQNYLNYLVFFSSLLIACSENISNISSAYFIFIALCCLIVKKTLNGRYYTDFILACMHYRIAILMENRELDKIKGFNKKQFREYSRMMKLKKRKSIKDKKRARQSVEK
ncbi:hypothetical protein Xbed_01306 [Xenorhabdus beddingii]|uniref:Uncharacterized protein n=1 Tax=Xenorhabdus beddingii TaxID=40578 RepID=A0A1Y2SQV3_9GAMM|nr:hypothetical protein [Xenorhabdus beddingii]OTA20502.1 hypothetical protein Xbed_01306 [Xenorhabdus beddingii]